MFLMFLGYMLPFEIAPRIYQFIQDEQQTIESLRTKIAQAKELARKTEVWRTDYDKLKAERDSIYAKLLPFDSHETKELVSVKMQEILRKLAQQSGVVYKTMGNTEFATTGDWVVITQPMQFGADSKTLFQFLQAIAKAPQAFTIAGLTVQGGGRGLEGTIRLTGFTHVPPPLSENPPVKSPENPAKKS
jgi:hypothetical protein